MTQIHLSAGSPNHPPLDPNAAQAHAQLAHELAKPQYTSAHPTVVQNASQSLLNWFESLFSGFQLGGDAASGIVIIIIGAVVIAAAIIAFLVFGVPRMNRRSAVSGSIFGDEDDRDSNALLRAAERAASSGDFAAAIEEGFRAIARGLSERVIVTTFPGTTAHSFAVQAAIAFPDNREQLGHAADLFDTVRYLGGSATEADWLVVSALQRALRTSRPELESSEV